MTSNVFEDYSAYYDLLYHDKDYAKEADYVAQTLRAADPSVSDLLEFGSGTGSAWPFAGRARFASSWRGAE